MGVHKMQRVTPELTAHRRFLIMRRRVRAERDKWGYTSTWAARHTDECAAFLSSIVGGVTDKKVHWAVYMYNKNVLRNEEDKHD